MWLKIRYSQYNTRFGWDRCSRFSLPDITDQMDFNDNCNSGNVINKDLNNHLVSFILFYFFLWLQGGFFFFSLSVIPGKSLVMLEVRLRACAIICLAVIPSGHMLTRLDICTLCVVHFPNCGWLLDALPAFVTTIISSNNTYQISFRDLQDSGSLSSCWLSSRMGTVIWS